MKTPKDTIVSVGQDWSTAANPDEAFVACASEALSILDQRITAALTPALNTGTAMEALVLTGTAIRELRAELEPAALDPHRPLGICELLASIGDDNIKFQNLFDSATNYNLHRKPVATAITFLTDAVTPTEIMNGTQTKVGLVVWLPREQTEALLASRRKPATT